MIPRALTLLACVALAAGCGDEPAPASDAFTSGGSNSGGAGPDGVTGCTVYCDFVVTHGTGCAEFNEGGRCVANCSKYAAGACAPEWAAFRVCVQKSASVSCIENDGGPLILSTTGCSAENNAWNTCLEEKDAGICLDGGK